MNIFFLDCIEPCQLIEWLSGIYELNNLSLTCKHNKEQYRKTRLIEIITIKNLSMQANDFGFNSIEIFDTFMIKHDLTLSESLLLQAIIGENWKGTQLKLFAKNFDKVSFISDLESLNYSYIGSNHDNNLLSKLEKIKGGSADNLSEFQSIKFQSKNLCHPKKVLLDIRY